MDSKLVEIGLGSDFSLAFWIAYKHRYNEQCKQLIYSLQEGLSTLPHLLRTAVQPFLEHYQFVILQQDESDLVYQQASQLMDLRSKQPLLADAFTMIDCHVYNVCLALLKREAFTRCCVLWAKYWDIDVVQAGNSEWYDLRVKETNDALKDCIQNHRSFFHLHLYVLSLWRELMLREGVLRQVLAMEVNSALYHK